MNKAAIIIQLRRLRSENIFNLKIRITLNRVLDSIDKKHTEWEF